MAKNNTNYSKKDVLKLLSQLGIDTRFISYCHNTIFINNLRFSKFSKTKEEIFNKYFPEITVIRSKIFQKICIRASKVLRNALSPKEKILLFKCQNFHEFILSIILEPYTRKYGIKLVFVDFTIFDLANLEPFAHKYDFPEINSIALSNTLNNETIDIIKDIFAGNKIVLYDNFSSVNYINNTKILKPLSMVSNEWINSFAVGLDLKIISNNLNINYDTDMCIHNNNTKLELEFMEFAESIVIDFKENIMNSAKYIENNRK